MSPSPSTPSFPSGNASLGDTHRDHDTNRPCRSYSRDEPVSLRRSGRGTLRRQSAARLQGALDELESWQCLGELVEENGKGEMSNSQVAEHRNSLGFTGSQRLRSWFSQQDVSCPVKVPSTVRSNGDVSSNNWIAVLSSSPPQIDEVDAQENNGDPGTLASAAEIHDNGDDEGRSQCTPESGIPYEQRTDEGQPERPEPREQTRIFWHPSRAVIAVLKCSLAYLIASLFTFVPALATLLSTSSETDAHGRITWRPAFSAHMVATVVVYFNPAKTLGGMLLASRFCLILALFATTVCLLSMSTIAIFDLLSPSHGTSWDWISELGDWVVCVLWIGGSMGSLAWLKIWVGNPSFNSGCSMAAVTIYTVVIKEGNMPKLLEVLVIVLIGVSISNLVCFAVFPESATSRLQRSISTSLKSFATLLDLLTSTFLKKRHVARGSDPTIRDAVKAHTSAFNTLHTDFNEAKRERVLDKRIRGRRVDLYEAAIGSLTRLAQHLSGLRSSTKLQEGLVSASRDGRITLDLTGSDPSASHLPDLDPLDVLPRSGVKQDASMPVSVRLFLDFRRIAGAQLDLLVDRCEDALNVISDLSDQLGPRNVEVAQNRDSVARALDDFAESSSRAIMRLYAGPRRERGLYEDEGDDTEEGSGPPEDIHTDGPNETVFLIYFFLFTLEEFAREVLYLLDTVTEIGQADEVTALDHLKSLWRSKVNEEPNKGSLYKQLGAIVPIDPSDTQPPLFPRNQQDSRGTVLTPSREALPFWAKLSNMTWELGAFLREPTIRYAIKTGLGGAILAAPAYTEVGRPIFLEYRGEWALIAYFATMSPTVGQTNLLSTFRVIGTILGALVAVVVYNIFPDHPVLLPIFGFFFSMPCFYVITQMPDYAQASRFILLTYNLTCLYAYNQRDREITVEWIAIHRSTSVIIGVIWAAIVTRYWWPFTARRELRMGISDFCLDLSYLYSKLVTTYSHGVDVVPHPAKAANSEQEPLLPTYPKTAQTHLNTSVRQFMAMELHLQSQLVSLRDLLKQTRNEPRLKGPFAFEFYKEVLLSCERMVDRLHSMRCVTTRDEWNNGIRQAFVIPVNKQRREMAGNVMLYFYTLSAGFRLRTPLPPYLPPAEEARQRLVDAIRNLDVVKRRSVRGGGRHLLFFAYALAMQEVIAELEYLGVMMQEAFGVISQSTVIQFEALFRESP